MKNAKPCYGSVVFYYVKWRVLFMTICWNVAPLCAIGYFLYCAICILNYWDIVSECQMFLIFVYLAVLGCSLKSELLWIVSIADIFKNIENIGYFRWDIYHICILQHWIGWCQLKGLCLSCIFQNGATKNNNNSSNVLCSSPGGTVKMLNCFKVK